MEDPAQGVSSSLEATKTFKTQISKCLPLLGFLNATDKQDVWRFWKTISAAVKIAVDGKGNIMQLPKHSKKSIMVIDKNLERNRLQELDQNAISIYVPLRSLNSDRLKYRVLKFADQRKIGDYIEDVQLINPGDKNDVENVSAEVSTNNSTDMDWQDMDVCIEGLQPSISDLITVTTKKSTDESLKLITNCLQNDFSKSATNNSMSISKENLSVSSMRSPQVNTKRIWPVGRPTTRSFSMSINNLSAKSSLNNEMESTISSSNASSSGVDRLYEPQLKEQNEMEPTSLYPDLDIIDFKDNFRDDSDLAHVKESNFNLQAKQSECMGKLESNICGNRVELQTTQNVKVTSLDTTVELVSNTIPALEIHVNDIPNENKSNNGDSLHSTKNTPPTTSSEQLKIQTGQPRNASDIETIISALEEELKKSGSNLSGISVPTSSRPQHTTHSLAQSPLVSGISNAYETAEGLHFPHSPNMNPSQGQSVLSSSHAHGIQASCLDLEASAAHHEKLASRLENNVNSSAVNADDSMQAFQNQASVQITACVDEPEQSIKLHQTPLRVTAYIDEAGRPIQTSSGQVMALLNDTGQAVQILQGQEVLEVEGSIDNIIWACDGEVQVLQQQQKREQQDGLQDEISHNMDNIQERPDLIESQPVQAHYDVVEYEVLSDKQHRRGRKKKVKTYDTGNEKPEPTDEENVNSKENTTGNSEDTLDRTCPICHRVLNYASSLKAHMRIHTGARPYSCGQCGRKFTTKANRDRHEATHVGLKPFKCEECHKSFTEKRSLKIHMRSHTGERPYVCETCGQGFAQNCTLQVHKVRHTDRRAHLCDLCGKAFRQKNQLEIHVKRHNRQAAYPCDQCETRCYTRGDLVRHMIKHTGERPFSCKLCPRAFTRKQYLVDHENQHYDRKPYKCSECGVTFHDMGSCHRHLRKHKQNAKDEKSESTPKNPQKLPVLNAEAVHTMLGNAKPGQVVKLEDGTNAILKQITCEPDGSAVYHITCLGVVNDGTSTTVLSQQLQQQNAPVQNIEQPDSIVLTQDARIKVEDSKL
ncbi:Zinc finger protein [Plakobranchus ocellatus]|uniref:Zinc finger protein n=1 Tax=Plakobranchus ocellatus TaxID=259542 RepID=A0AAV3YQL5_9GAST|nr:Zinc finger protein [Plakobranchus ocellatus]